MREKNLSHVRRLEQADVGLSALEQYLSNKLIVKDVLSHEDLDKKIKIKKPLNIMMGQTFDKGQPVDLLKYGLFMMDIGNILEAQGIDVSAKWLIADHFITDINQDEERSQVMGDIKRRVAFLQALNVVYGGNIGIVFSSELSQLPEYNVNLNALVEELDTNPDFREKVLEAVPKDRRDNPRAIRYPLEELATIQTMNTDIKVGPPYERHYDEPAREIAGAIGFNRYIGIHLTRGFPFGKPEVLDGATVGEIEEFGILPYKLNSKGLGEFRVDPTVDSLEKTINLILGTKDERALVDLIAIAELAQTRLCKHDQQVLLHESLRGDLHSLLQSNQLTYGSELFTELQNLAIDVYKKYVYTPLRGK